MTRRTSEDLALDALGEASVALQAAATMVGAVVMLLQRERRGTTASDAPNTGANDDRIEAAQRNASPTDARADRGDAPEFTLMGGSSVPARPTA